VKRARHLTATELADACVCEQRLMFDRARGARRTAVSRQRMAAGKAVHLAWHRAALRERSARARDRRCFVATALWGQTDPRTVALRAWRDRWLLARWWGPKIVAGYYAASPWLVACLSQSQSPRLRSTVDTVLSAVVRRLVRAEG